MAEASFWPGSIRSPRAWTRPASFSARSWRRRRRRISLACGSPPSSSASRDATALRLPGDTSPMNMTAKPTDRAMSPMARIRSTATSDLDVHDTANPDVADYLHHPRDGHHQLSHWMGEQELHVGRVDEVDRDADDDGQHRERIAGEPALRRVDLELSPDGESGADHVRQVVEHLRQIAAHLALDQDRGDQDAHVHQVHPVRHRDDGVVERKPEPLLLERALELAGNGLLSLVRHHLEPRGQWMPRPDGAAQQVDGLWQTGLERVGPLSPPALEIPERQVGPDCGSRHGERQVAGEGEQGKAEPDAEA